MKRGNEEPRNGTGRKKSENAAGLWNRKGGSREKERGFTAAKQRKPDEMLQITGRDLIREIVYFLLIDAVISYLFFRSRAAFLILLPGAALWVSERKKELIRRKKDVMRSQFLMGIRLVSMSLRSGSAFENAVRDAGKELGKLYGGQSFIPSAFAGMSAQFARNVSAEEALDEFAERSGMEEILNFAEIFRTARRTGGDLTAILRNTAAGMEQREETRKEIETVIAGKAAEQKIMSVIPLFMLAYADLTSPETMEVMYRSAAGRIVMAAALLLYLAAFFWGKKIMEIEV